MNVKKKPSKRILAALLALLVLLTMGQTGLIGAFAADSGFTIVVNDKDNEESAVSGAVISDFEAFSSADSTEISADIWQDASVLENITTNSDGEAVIPGIEEYFEANPKAEILLSFTVSADGYQKYTQIAAGAIINSENCLEKFSVSLERNPSVTVVKKDAPDDAEISAVYFENEEDTEGTQINLEDDAADYVPVGSYVQFTVENVDYYNISCSAQNGDEEAQPVAVESNTYKYQVTADFTFTVLYTAVTVNIEVIYDTENGSITVDGDSDPLNSPADVKVDKNADSTVFTITPNANDHYVLDEIISTIPEKDRVLDETDTGYTLTIANENLDADTDYTLEFTFKLDQYQVKYFSDDEDKGFVTASVENESDVEAFTQVTFTFEPANNQSKLIAVLVNNSYVSFDSIIYADGKYSLTISIKSDTEIKAIFDEVDNTTFAETSVNSLFDVTVASENGKLFADPNNSESNDLVFYVNEAASVTLSLNRKGVEAVVSDINRNIQIDAIFNDNDTFAGNEKSYTVSINDADNDNEVVLNSLQIVEFSDLISWNIKTTYVLPGSITFKFDATAPSISDIENIDHTNVPENIDIEVTDALSGVKSVEAIRSYGTTKDEEVTVTDLDNNGNYSLQFVPVDGTCDVTYTVIATDNVGNKSEEDFTVSNDTQAPELKNGKAITFKTGSKNVFHYILNAISFGKWFEDEANGEYITVTVKAQDAGAGFDGEKSTAKVVFYPSDSEDSKSYFANINKEGTATIKIPKSDFSNGVLEGTFGVKLSDKLGNSSDEILVATGNSNIGDNDSGVVMIESIKPTVTIEPSPMLEKSYTLVEGDEAKLIYNGGADFKINMNDQNSGLYSYEVTINGTERLNEDELTIDGDKQLYKEEISVNTVDPIKIETDKDGKYVVTAIVTDNSGNEKKEECIVYKDATAPIVTGFEFNLEDGFVEGKDNISNAVEVTDYGFYFKEDVKVTVTAEDRAGENQIASGVQSIDVYLVDEYGNKTEPEITYSDNNTAAVFTIEKDFKGQIYARPMDNVDNTAATETAKLPKPGEDEKFYTTNNEGYFYPDGAVVESLEKHSETSSIVIEAPQAAGTQNNAYSYIYDLNENAVADNELSYPDSTVKVPLYNSDPTFDVTVSDTYSGIRSIKWTVIEGGEARSEIVELENTVDKNSEFNGWTVEDNDTNTNTNLVTQMSRAITVSGNYNDMVLVVELTDRAGNVSYDYYTFGIDKTAPGISVSYDNNNADQRSGSTYFKADRTATIVVTERNFNSENVVVTVTRDGKAYPVALTWRDENGAEANGDGTRHITSIAYNADGDYTFAVSYTDRAQNQNTPVDYGSSLAPAAFTVDKTAPVITVSYNNNNAQNGKYFRAQRTATIVIAEHNFDVNRVVFTRTAALRGSNTALPEISWNHNGDVHTATINYNADGDYTFDITMDDMAGNVNNGVDYGASVAANDFTVDQTIIAPTILFSDKENGEEADDKEKRSFNDIIKTIISVDDANYSSVNVSLTRISKTGEVSGNLVDMIAVPNGNGTVTSDNFPEEIENDGIYTLTVTLSDLAGNVKTSEEEFTVNRYGSVFVFNEVLNTAVSKNYNKSIAGNAVITEYNADPISEPMIQVTRDGSAVSLSENVISQTGGTRSEEGWYQNVYTIPQAVFAQDGIYDIYISSKDKSGNTPEMSADNIYSDMSTLAGRDATFIVDATKPQIVNVYSDDAELSGESINENLEELTINYEISDNIAIGTIEVYDGLTGSQIGETVIMDDYVKDAKSGESRSYTSYKGWFEIPDGARNDEVYFVITDKAGNIINTSSDNDDPNTLFDMSAFEFLRDITVSTNPFIRWYANRPLFWGTIGAAAAVVLGALLIVFLKKRKNNDKEESEG